MAVEQASGPAKGRTLVRNIGLLLSGDLAAPLLDADAIVIEDGRIAAIGRATELAGRGPADGVIDAHGCAVCARPDRQPRASGVRRLDAAAEPARLDRLAA